MTYQPSTFPADLGIASRVGLTRGVGTLGSSLGSFADAEMRYRQDRLLREASFRRRNERKIHRSSRTNQNGSQRFGREVMSRWTTWLPSVPLLHRSSPAQPSSSGCAN